MIATKIHLSTMRRRPPMRWNSFLQSLFGSGSSFSLFSFSFFLSFLFFLKLFLLYHFPIYRIFFPLSSDSLSLFLLLSVLSLLLSPCPVHLFSSRSAHAVKTDKNGIVRAVKQLLSRCLYVGRRLRERAVTAVSPDRYVHRFPDEDRQKGVARCKFLQGSSFPSNRTIESQRIYSSGYGSLVAIETFRKFSNVSWHL